MQDRLFSGNHIVLYQQQRAGDVYKRVMRMNKGELEEAESGTLARSMQLTPLKLDWDSLVSLGQREKRSKAYDSIFDEEREIVEPIYSFEVPYSGSGVLLGLQPSTSNQLRVDTSVGDDTIAFEIVGADPAQLNRIKEFMNQNAGALNSELGAVNEAIETAVQQAVAARNEQLQKNDEGLAAFGVPLKEE
ncbi:MAG: hypothetical protein JWN26_57 [Candidatus Saccharibacteria bacterium]|nr:hypothetical protein [Candidatus Saccharibacteria bacterium]